MVLINAPISIGELIDKITILEIKVDRLSISRSENVAKELSLLVRIYEESELNIDSNLISGLHTINEELWDIEDQIRIKEYHNDFGQEFINLARSVYVSNDKRSNLKRFINTQYGSSIIEEKSYTKY